MITDSNHAAKIAAIAASVQQTLQRLLQVCRKHCSDCCKRAENIAAIAASVQQTLQRLLQACKNIAAVAAIVQQKRSSIRKTCLRGQRNKYLCKSVVRSKFLRSIFSIFLGKYVGKAKLNQVQLLIVV